MKDIRAALRTYLLADATVSGLVGASRIFPAVLPQGQTSASLVQNLISEETDYHMQGPSGLAAARVQIDAWAQTPDEAVALANAAKDWLSGLSGDVYYGASSPLTQVTIRAVFVEQGRDSYDDAAKLHGRARDYVVWYLEN